jgi:hypothetical protein
MGKRLKSKTNLQWGIPNRDMGGLVVVVLQYMKLLIPLLVWTYCSFVVIYGIIGPTPCFFYNIYGEHELM